MKIANVAVGGPKRPNWPGLLGWLTRRRPDIVALQKIWGAEDFPRRALREIGYKSEHLGKKDRSDLGVALLSRSSLPPPKMVPCPRYSVDSRFLTVDVCGLRVSSVYAPYGPTIARRVAWLDCLRNHVEAEEYARRDSLLCGDFNVKIGNEGPRGRGYSEREEDALRRLIELGFHDLYRKAHPNPEARPGRTRGYDRRHSEGTSRLHLILASESLARRLRSACVDIAGKPWPRDDAPPLVVQLDRA